MFGLVFELLTQLSKSLTEFGQMEKLGIGTITGVGAIESDPITVISATLAAVHVFFREGQTTVNGNFYAAIIFFVPGMGFVHANITAAMAKRTHHNIPLVTKILTFTKDEIGMHDSNG